MISHIWKKYKNWLDKINRKYYLKIKFIKYQKFMNTEELNKPDNNFILDGTVYDIIESKMLLKSR